MTFSRKSASASSRVMPKPFTSADASPPAPPDSAPTGRSSGKNVTSRRLSAPDSSARAAGLSTSSGTNCDIPTIARVATTWPAGFLTAVATALTPLLGLARTATPVRRTSANSASVAFVTDGRTEVGATIPEAGNFPGVLQSTTPGQLQLTGVPRAAGIRQGQTVVTSGFKVRNLLSVYPPGIPVGVVTSFGSQEVDVQQTVQVTPYVDPRKLTYLVVLVPTSPKAKERAAG